MIYPRVHCRVTVESPFSRACFAGRGVGLLLSWRTGGANDARGRFFTPFAGVAAADVRAGGRVVECTGLENRRTARSRGFESLPARFTQRTQTPSKRHAPVGPWLNAWLSRRVFRSPGPHHSRPGTTACDSRPAPPASRLWPFSPCPPRARRSRREAPKPRQPERPLPAERVGGPRNPAAPALPAAMSAQWTRCAPASST